MGDLCFAESLQMLEGSDYSPWVKVIFEGIKKGAQLRAFRWLSKLTNYFVGEFIMKNPKVRAKQVEHWNYSKDRVDRRLAMQPDRPDLWTKILEKGAPNDPTGLSLGEHHSLAARNYSDGLERYELSPHDEPGQARPPHERDPLCFHQHRRHEPGVTGEAKVSNGSPPGGPAHVPSSAF
jgi:hypothetical protein